MRWRWGPEYLNSPLEVRSACRPPGRTQRTVHQGLDPPPAPAQRPTHSPRPTWVQAEPQLTGSLAFPVRALSCSCPAIDCRPAVLPRGGPQDHLPAGASLQLLVAPVMPPIPPEVLPVAPTLPPPKPWARPLPVSSARAQPLQKGPATAAPMAVAFTLLQGAKVQGG